MELGKYWPYDSVNLTVFVYYINIWDYSLQMAPMCAATQADTWKADNAHEISLIELVALAAEAALVCMQMRNYCHWHWMTGKGRNSGERPRWLILSSSVPAPSGKNTTCPSWIIIGPNIRRHTCSCTQPTDSEIPIFCLGSFEISWDTQ